MVTKKLGIDIVANDDENETLVFLINEVRSLIARGARSGEIEHLNGWYRFSLLDQPDRKSVGGLPLTADGDAECTPGHPDSK